MFQNVCRSTVTSTQLEFKKDFRKEDYNFNNDDLSKLIFIKISFFFNECVVNDKKKSGQFCCVFGSNNNIF